jgi:hypothetical protein
LQGVPRRAANETKDVLSALFAVAEASKDFLVGSRGFVFDQVFFGQSRGPRGGCQGLMQLLLNRVPDVWTNKFIHSWLQAVFRRVGIFVQPLPAFCLRHDIAFGEIRFQGLEFGG